MRTIGVSIISFLPGVMMPWRHASVRGALDGLSIQLLPLRGLRLEHVTQYPVLSFEGPWDCGTLFNALKRTVGMKGRYPSLVDIALFGSQKATYDRVRMIARACPKALPIDVPWLPGSAIELSPTMYQGNARRWDDELPPSGVVLDTHHWRSFSMNEAEKRLEQLGGQPAIRMVHLKLMDPQETEDFVKGKGENLAVLREFLAHDKAKTIPVVIEARPGALYKPGVPPTVVLKWISSQIDAEVI